MALLKIEVVSYSSVEIEYHIMAKKTCEIERLLISKTKRSSKLNYQVELHMFTKNTCFYKKKLKIMINTIA